MGVRCVPVVGYGCQGVPVVGHTTWGSAVFWCQPCSKLGVGCVLVSAL